MKYVILCLALVGLVACESGYQQPRPVPADQPETGITLSGSARFGVVYGGGGYPDR